MSAKNTIFICQITENALKVVKCLANVAKKEFLGIEVEPIAANIEEQKLTAKITEVLKKLGYNNHPLVVSLPRNQATCRYLKIPSHSPREIARIAALQAANYLPYPAEELITAYQIISLEKNGYANINLVITHKNVIERYLKIFNELKASRFSIVLSSYGLADFYDYLNPQENKPVMILDLEANQAELAIGLRKKVLFSRAFKINRLLADWQDLFIEEVKRSHDAYSKDIAAGDLAKIVLISAVEIPPGFMEAFSKRAGLKVEAVAYKDKIIFAPGLADNLAVSGNSLVSPIGLGLKDWEGNLNLLPQQLKEKIARASGKKERLKLSLLILGIILVSSAGLAINLNNKSRYLKELKTQLNTIVKEAKPLEEVEKRLKLLENRSERGTSALGLLSELHQVIPQGISLTGFGYEQGQQVTLRGQAPGLDGVFNFVAKLEQSAVFKGFNVKVRYASKKKALSGQEFVDFEIVCLLES